MKDTYYVLRSLHAVGLLEGDTTKGLIDYIVKRGYDSDDLLALSSKKGGYRRAIHLISLVADVKPDYKNKHFMAHITAFTQNAMEDLPTDQGFRLLHSLFKLKHFKNERLIK